MTRGRLCGIAVGLCLGLALLVAPAALATTTVSGTVNAVAADGAGGYYAAGSFTVTSSSIVNAVHIKHDGTVDASWAPNPNGTVKALAVSGKYGVSGSSVYLGGSFTIGALHNAARVDATTGALDSGWAPEPDGVVNAIALTADRAYLGGSFSQVSASSGTASRGNAAAIGLKSGHDLGWDPSPNGPVNALAVLVSPQPAASAVYIGGSFTQIDSSSSSPVVRSNAAAVDLYQGFDNGWDPNPDGQVDALSISGSTVYLGGSFTTISAGVISTSRRLSGFSTSVRRPNAAAVTAGSGQDTGWKPAPDGEVHALAVSGNTVYLAGAFSHVNASGSSTAARTDAAGVDAVTGYDTGWNVIVAGTVRGVATWNTDVYLGGDFGLASSTVAQHLLSVVESLTGGATGTVTSTTGGINCPSTCSDDFDHGSTVTLSATGDPGSGFVGWSGDCSGTSPNCNVTVDAVKNVTATFNVQHPLFVGVAGGSGTVTSSPSGITCPGTCSAPFTDGTPVKLTALPTAGYAFTNWTGGACFGNVTPTCTFTMSLSAGPVVAHFIQTHQLTAARDGNGSGSVTSSPAGLDCPATACAHPFDDGADVVLTATPAAGSRFDHWSVPPGDPSCPGTGTCDVNLTQDTTVTATFVQQHMLIVARNGSGSGTVSGGLGAINCGSGCNHAYDQGTTVSLTAAAAPGSIFAGWSGNGCAGASSTCMVTLSSDIHVTATFTAQGTKPPPPPPPTTTTTTPTKPPPPPPPKTPAPKCSLTGGPSRVLLAARRKGRSKVKPGTLSATVRCDRATTVTLSGAITELVGKKPKHGKQRTKSFKLGSLRVSMKAKGSKTLTFSLPRPAFTDLKHRASMSVALTLTATGASSHVKATIARLTGY